jgi:thioredoxin 1
MPVTQVKGSEFEREVLQHDGIVVVDFYAQWCPPCRALAPLLDRFAQENADRVKVVKVDTDTDEDLAARYGVRTIPTLIAFKGGQEVARAINPQSRAKLEELIAAAG